MESKKQKDTNIYMFNIVTEAKMDVLLIMTAKNHPEWSRDEVISYLDRLLEFCSKKQFEKGEIEK